jgi:hypothetical protein
MPQICIKLLILAAFFVLFWGTLFAQIGQNDVIINEFIVNPYNGKEWVELLVTKHGGGISLNNWVLTDVSSRTAAGSGTEGHLYFPNQSYLNLIPQGTRIVLVLHTPIANTVQFTQDLDPSDGILILFSKGIAGGVLDTGRTMDLSTNENIVLLNDTAMSTATVIDYVASGTNNSIGGWSGAVWTNNLPTSTNNTVQYFTNSAGVGFNNDNGNIGWMANRSIVEATPGQVNIGQIVSVSEMFELPIKFSLDQNYPNPFNPSTQIKYTISKTSLVTLKIYDLLGREIATLVNGKQQAGEYTARWNAESVPSGMYIYRIVAGNYVETKKMILMK